MGELASAAYTVYLIHPWVVVPIVRSSSEFARVVARPVLVRPLLLLLLLVVVVLGHWCWCRRRCF